MTKTQTLFLLLVSFSLGVEPDNIHVHPHHPLSLTPAPLHPPHHHDRHHHAPAKPPIHHHHHAPPAPAYHYLSKRSFIAVEGFVFKQSCKKSSGVDPLWGATPIMGAVMKLECNNTKKALIQTTQTNMNGYFLIKTEKSVTTYGAHKCKVFLVSEPNGLHRTNIYDGIQGVTFNSEHRSLPGDPDFSLYGVPDLAFAFKCPHTLENSSV